MQNNDERVVGVSELCDKKWKEKSCNNRKSRDENKKFKTSYSASSLSNRIQLRVRRESGIHAD